MTHVRYWFDDALVAAKITDEAASWHVCRHTFCSRLVAAGVPLPDVKEYAGHSDIRTTMRYTHGIEGVSDVRNREAMNRQPTAGQPWPGAARPGG
jgi:site-specific recombinase XerD